MTAREDRKSLFWEAELCRRYCFTFTASRDHSFVPVSIDQTPGLPFFNRFSPESVQSICQPWGSFSPAGPVLDMTTLRSNERLTHSDLGGAAEVLQEILSAQTRQCHRSWLASESPNFAFLHSGDLLIPRLQPVETVTELHRHQWQPAVVEVAPPPDDGTSVN